MKKFHFLLALILICASCKKTEKINKLKVASWLICHWENNMEQGKLSETWEAANDSTYNGTSYFIKEKDTLHHEVILLTQKGNEVYYIPTVQGQNSDQPVTFKLERSTSKQMIFINRQHDFPQKIVYRKVMPDSLIAEISGMENGKPKSERYAMTKN